MTGERLQQVEAGLAHGGHDRGTQLAVVHGVGQGVGARRGGEVQLEVEVDHERLAPLLLLGEHPVAPEGAQAAQLDAIGLFPTVRVQAGVHGRRG